MRIVIDIDNTIVDYRPAVISSIISNQKNDFLKSGLTSEDSIITIKNFLKKNYGEDFWQLVQSEIYSTNKNIFFYRDVSKVIKDLAFKYDIYLVSHKTKYGIGKSKDINILKISTKRIYKWMLENDLLDSIKSIIFCESFDEKIKMINLINPKVIVDDLEKIHLQLLDIFKKDKPKKHFILFKGTSLNYKETVSNEIISLNNWMQIFEYLRADHEIRK